MSAITWHELITTDVEGATGFYTELLGLELERADMGDFEYPMLKRGDRTHAGFVKQEMEDVPSHCGSKGTNAHPSTSLPSTIRAEPRTAGSSTCDG